MPPVLRQHETPFTGVDTVVIDAATHGLGAVTIHRLIVQVLEPPGGGAPLGMVPPDAYLYRIDPESFAVTVQFQTPRDGTVRLTTIDNVVEA